MQTTKLRGSLHTQTSPSFVLSLSLRLHHQKLTAGLLPLHHLCSSVCFAAASSPPSVREAMDTLHHRRRRLSTVFAFLVLAAALGIALAGMLEEAGEPVRSRNRELISVARRRLLIVPGSWPPTCRARCGRCLPCVTVHVAIQPGRTVPLEYYPEAWRCKCGNKLFTP